MKEHYVQKDSLVSRHISPGDMIRVLFFSTLLLLPLNPFFPQSILPLNAPWNDFLPLLVVSLLIIVIYNKLSTQKDMGHIRVHYFILPLMLITLVSIAGLEHPSIPALVRIISLTLSPLLLVPFFQKQSYKVLIYIVMGIACLHAQWAILQFSAQSPLGFYQLGEAHALVNEPGIAKFSLGSYKIVRAYGPYQHSNVLAGSLISIFILALYTLASVRICSAEKLYLTVTSYLLYLAILLTFSRAAYISLALAIGMYLIYKFINNKQLIRKKQFSSSNSANILVPFLLTLIVLVPLLTFRGTDPNDMAVNERVRAYEWSRSIITSHHWWRGSGIGRYTNDVHHFLNKQNVPFELWEIAPVHSVPILLLSEWGIAGMSLLLIFVLYLFRFHFNKKYRLILVAVLIIITPLLLTDHYFVTSTTPGVLLMVILTLLWLKPVEANDQ